MNKGLKPKAHGLGFRFLTKTDDLLSTRAKFSPPQPCISCAKELLGCGLGLRLQGPRIDKNGTIKTL